MTNSYCYAISIRLLGLMAENAFTLNCCAFPTTFVDHSTFPMNKKNFYDFIKNPKDFVRKKMSSYGVKPEEQLLIEQLEIEFND